MASVSHLLHETVGPNVQGPFQWLKSMEYLLVEIMHNVFSPQKGSKFTEIIKKVVLYFTPKKPPVFLVLHCDTESFYNSN